MADNAYGRTLDVAVVGAGRFGAEHARRYAQRDDCRLSAVVDPDVARAEAVAARFDAAAVYSDLDQLVTAGVDAVSVVNPGAAHVATAETLLAAGVPVLVEKPVALTVAEGEQLLAAERESTAFVLPGHVLRFSAPYIELREQIDAGRVGTVLAIAFSKHRTIDHDVRYAAEHPVMLTGIHDIDMALWLTGERIRDVRSIERRTQGRNQPVAVFSELITESGIAVQLTNTWSLAEGALVPDRVEVFGTEGMLRLELAPRVSVPGGGPVDDELAPLHAGGALTAELDHFLRCVRTGRSSTVVTAAEAVAAIAVAERVVAAGGAA